MDSDKYHSGWLFRFIQEGWLRKRWRKRWCILKNDNIILYEFEPKTDEDKEIDKINLEKYANCKSGTKKEIKKFPNSFSLEVAPQQDDNASPKSKAVNKRELFYAESESDKESWMTQLNEQITIARLGVTKTLDHVTKARPKMTTKQRRRPTRNHLRERARESEFSSNIDIDGEEISAAPKKRGHIPTAAIKPPPSKALKPLKPNGGDQSIAQSNSESLPVKKTLLRSKSVDENELENSETSIQKYTPPIPSKALKPTLKSMSVDSIIYEEDETTTNSKSVAIQSNESNTEPNDETTSELKEQDKNKDGEKKLQAPTTPKKALKPKLQKSISLVKTEKENAENGSNKRSPSKPPPVPKKPSKSKLQKAFSEDILKKEDIKPETAQLSPVHPPPPPSKALKPNVKKISTKSAQEKETENSDVLTSDSSENETKENEIDKNQVDSKTTPSHCDSDQGDVTFSPQSPADHISQESQTTTDENEVNKEEITDTETNKATNDENVENETKKDEKIKETDVVEKETSNEENLESEATKNLDKKSKTNEDTSLSSDTNDSDSSANALPNKKPPTPSESSEPNFDDEKDDDEIANQEKTNNIDEADPVGKDHNQNNDNQKDDNQKEDNLKEDNLKEDNLKEDNPKEDNPKVDNPKVDNLKEDDQKDDYQKEDNLKEDNQEEDNQEEDNPKENNLKEDNQEEDNPKEDNPLENQESDKLENNSPEEKTSEDS